MVLGLIRLIGLIGGIGGRCLLGALARGIERNLLKSNAKICKNANDYIHLHANCAFLT